MIGEPSSPRVLDCGQIRLGSKRPMSCRLALLHRELRSLVDRLEPSAAAVETPFHGTSAKAALQLAQARGVILAVLGEQELAVAEYTPAAVKLSVTGDGRADKAQVSAMVVRLLGASVAGRRFDVHDALAVALCHLSTARFQAAVARARER